MRQDMPASLPEEPVCKRPCLSDDAPVPHGVDVVPTMMSATERLVVALRVDAQPFNPWLRSTLRVGAAEFVPSSFRASGIPAQDDCLQATEPTVLGLHALQRLFTQRVQLRSHSDHLLLLSPRSIQKCVRFV